MPTGKDIRPHLKALLRPDEAVRHVVPVTTEIIGVFSVSFFDTYIVVTDARVLVVTGGALRRGRPRHIDREFPRRTRLGPVEHTPAPTITLGSVRYEIDDDAVEAVLAADAEIGYPRAA